MSVELTPTSDFRALVETAQERNLSREWQRVLEIKPSVNRIVRLRGRPPYGQDIADIYYDLVDFAQISVSLEELTTRLSRLAELEATYYPLAQNYGARAALSAGLYERIPDFIDTAKDLTAKVVWSSWKPDRGENYIDLHRRIVANLKRLTDFGWNKAYRHSPFSYIENSKLENSLPYHQIETHSPKVKPRLRLRSATLHLSLPTVIAIIDERGPIEKIAALSLMGYFPDGKGLIGVAKTIGVKRETLSSALDRTLEYLTTGEDGYLPRRNIGDIVQELIQEGVIHYPSGKNVERTNPRLTLLGVRTFPVNLSKQEMQIFNLATTKNGNRLTYSTDEIAQQIGISKVTLCRFIKRLADKLKVDDSETVSFSY